MGIRGTKHMMCILAEKVRLPIDGMPNGSRSPGGTSYNKHKNYTSTKYGKYINVILNLMVRRIKFYIFYC